MPQLTDKCGIIHRLGGQVCHREKGHDGACRCKAEHGGGGSLTYSEWRSKGGECHRHIGYTTIYPKNGAKDAE